MHAQMCENKRNKEGNRMGWKFCKMGEGKVKMTNGWCANI